MENSLLPFKKKKKEAWTFLKTCSGAQVPAQAPLPLLRSGLLSLVRLVLRGRQVGLASRYGARLQGLPPASRAPASGERAAVPADFARAATATDRTRFQRQRVGVCVCPSSVWPLRLSGTPFGDTLECARYGASLWRGASPLDLSLFVLLELSEVCPCQMGSLKRPVRSFPLCRFSKI